MWKEREKTGFSSCGAAADCSTLLRCVHLLFAVKWYREMEGGCEKGLTEKYRFHHLSYVL